MPKWCSQHKLRKCVSCKELEELVMLSFGWAFKSKLPNTRKPNISILTLRAPGQPFCSLDRKFRETCWCSLSGKIWINKRDYPFLKSLETRRSKRKIPTYKVSSTLREGVTFLCYIFRTDTNSTINKTFPSQGEKTSTLTVSSVMMSYSGGAIITNALWWFPEKGIAKKGAPSLEDWFQHKPETYGSCQLSHKLRIGMSKHS